MTNKVDSICEDSEVRAIREKTFSKLNWGPITASISRLMGMFGGPLLGTGLLGIIGFGGIAPAMFTPALIIAGIGATLSVMSIAVDFVGTRIQQDGWLDQTEIGAISTARHLVKELKANNMCLTDEHPHHCRKDGKMWSNIVHEPSESPHMQGHS